MAAGEALVVTLVDLLMILKVKLATLLLRLHLSEVGMAAGEALGWTVLEGFLVALESIVLKVKLVRLSDLAGYHLQKYAALSSVDL